MYNIYSFCECLKNGMIMLDSVKDNQRPLEFRNGEIYITFYIFLYSIDIAAGTAHVI